MSWWSVFKRKGRRGPQRGAKLVLCAPVVCPARAAESSEKERLGEKVSLCCMLMWICSARTAESSEKERLGGEVNKIRYPEVTMEELRVANPEVVLLSSEPFPFKEKHIAEIQTVLPEAEVLLVDGEMFSWYGSRMRWAAGYMSDLVGRL